MKTKALLLFLLTLLLASCAAQPAPLPAPASNAPLVLPQATEKVVKMATATPTADPAAPSPTPDLAADAANKVLVTKAGSLVFRSARFVDEVHGVKPYQDCKILLVFLERADGAPIDLQTFQDAGLHFLVRGDDGTEWPNSMGGQVGNEFALGYQVSQAAKTFQLVWPDQSVTDITAFIE